MTRPNDDVRAALEFHAATRYWRRAGDGDAGLAMGTPPDLEDAIWEENRSLEPYPFKVYETLEPIALPREFAPSSLPALRALAAFGSAGSTVPDRALLARIGLLSNGLLDRTVTVRDTVITYRTAGGTGARYHLELYFVCGDLPDLSAGVYHYSALDHALRRVRAGDVRAALGVEAPVVMAVTSTFWRNAWRYKARAYRHAFWDAGTSLSHVLAVAASAGVPAELVLGFADGPVNDLLGVDGVREATVALCALGRDDGGGAPAAVGALPPLDLPVRPVSPREVTFPAIPAMHRASSLTTADDVAAWRTGPAAEPQLTPSGPMVVLDPLPDDAVPPAPVEDVIPRRRSTRRYDTAAELSFRDFSTLLDRSTRPFAADAAVPLDRYLIVHAVEGLMPGVYLHHPRRGTVELLRAGDFRADAARIAVGQSYCADAHVNAYWLADLRAVLERYGNRGYRLAQLTAALQAGKLHLATHTLGLGACGSTSADDEVVEFFSPHAAGKSYLFVTVFGVRRRTSSPRR